MGDPSITRTAALGTTAVPGAVPDGALIAGRYRIERLLGRGGAKEVWLAHDQVLDRPVAVSRLRAGAAGPAAIERVTREARLTARLGENPRIVTVHDAVEDGDGLAIVARFMAGGSLAERLAAAPERRLPVAEVLRAGEELADALAHAHAHGVVHRDVKPDNAWLAADGSAALGDFGIALAPDEQGAAGATGTPYYVAPEQARGERAGPSADLYALGATLFELLTGRPPFAGATADAVIAQHQQAPPPHPESAAPGIPAALDALVLRLLAKDPAERARDAAEVRDALRTLRSAGAWTPGAEARPLVGRDRDLAAATDALRGALAGGPRILALAGEPGIGKTRVAGTVATTARARGALTVWGRAVEDGGAYGSWTEPVRELVLHAPGLPAETLALARALAGNRGSAGGGAPVTGEDARERVFDAVAALLDAAAAPSGLVLVLEDLHWADRSSLDLLRHVVRRLSPAARVLLMVTYRDAGLPEEHPLAGALDELHHARGFSRRHLEGLDLDEVRAFVGDDAPLRDTVVRDLHARTGGNPLFVAELARAVTDAPAEAATAVPEGVREAVLRRLAPLGEESRRALDAAAVLSRPFTVATVARIAGLAPPQARAALEPARVARLVTDVPEAPGRLAFAHAIVRDAVREALPPARRGPLHAAVVEVLRGGDARSAEVARHALVAAREGEDPQPAFELSVEAGREAEAVLAYAEAAGHFGDALEAIDDLGADATPAQRQEALERLAAATMDAGDVEAGRRHYRRAAAAARRAGDAEALARAALGFAEFKRYGETDREGVDLLEQALAALPGGDSALRVRVSALLGIRLPAEAVQRREAVVDDAVAAARRIGDEAALSSALWAAVLVNRRRARRTEQGLAADEIVALAPRVGDPNALLWAHLARFVDGLERGDHGRVEQALTAVEGLARERRRTYFQWCAILLRATWATFRGDLEHGAELSDRAVAIVREVSDDVDQEHVAQRAMLARLHDRADAADRPALRAYATRYADLPVWSALAADLELRLGREEDAGRLVASAAREDFGVLLASQDGLFAAAVLAEPVAAAGPDVQRERLYDLLTPYADLNPVMDHGWASWGPVERPLGLLAAALGRPEAAVGHLERAVGLARAWDAQGWERLAAAQLAEVRNKSL